MSFHFVPVQIKYIISNLFSREKKRVYFAFPCTYYMASNIYYDYNNVSSFHIGTYQIEGNMKYPTTSASLILCACFPKKKKKRKKEEGIYEITTP